jgi:HD-GYP domain-containing protein (c-di-GMP phosphodiesterase class II)
LEDPGQDLPGPEDGTGNGETAWKAGSFVLTAPPMPFSRALKTMLLEWEWRTVWSKGNAREPKKTAPLEPSTEIDAINLAERLKTAGEIYEQFLIFADKFLARFAEDPPPNPREAVEGMSTFARSVTARPLDMIQALGNARFVENARPAANSLSGHGVNTAIIALIIATQAKMPLGQMTELGLAALLHEMEMPWELAESFGQGQRLSDKDRKKLFVHPLLVYRQLRALNFPIQVCRATLEHHEHYDGSGFPRHLAGNKISLYARILAPACACFDRYGRPANRDLRKTLNEILKNPGGIYDGSVIKNLFFAVAAYL